MHRELPRYQADLQLHTQSATRQEDHLTLADVKVSSGDCLTVCWHQIPSGLNRVHGGQRSPMILTSPPRSKDQTDNTAQNKKKQFDVCPNAAMIQNQNPNPWIPCESNILYSFQCIPTSHDFSMMIRIIQDHASSSSSSKVVIRPHR